MKNIVSNGSAPTLFTVEIPLVGVEVGEEEIVVDLEPEISQYALASPWVEDEVEAALEKERQQQREVLFPMRLDESVMHTTRAWAAKLRRTRYIGDFTCWMDPQAYQKAFERLIRDLKQARQKY